MRRAVIDIGTNTVKLLVADVRDGQVTTLAAKDQTTRLGEGVNETRRLSPAAIARTIAAIDEYARQARELGAEKIIALTTSAARDAQNREEFLTGVRERCGLEVQVITGDREAELIFRGVSSDPAWTNRPLFVMDVGGGSAEFIQGRGRIERLRSVPLGAVRLTEQFRDDFAALCEHIRTTLHSILSDYDPRGREFIGTGGSIVTLAKILRDQTDHVTIDEHDLRALVMKLNSLPLEQRRQVPRLPPERADIIVAGGLVFVLALEALGAHQLTVSTRNLRYGALVS